MSIEKIFNEFGWDWYRIKPFYDKVIAQKKIGLGFGIAILIILPLVCSLPRDRVYRNNRVGYEILIPGGWKLKVSTDKLILTLTKEHGFSGKSEIKVKAELGNPYGRTGFDYIFNGIYPRLQHFYPNASLRIDDGPYDYTQKGVSWGAMAYSVDLAEYYEIYATGFNDYVLTVIFETSVNNKDLTKNDIKKIVNSVRVKYQKRVNILTDRKSNTFIEHPL
jgi:hypothetical protein